MGLKMTSNTVRLPSKTSTADAKGTIAKKAPKPVTIISRDAVRKLAPHVVNEAGETILASRPVLPIALPVKELVDAKNVSRFLTDEEREKARSLSQQEISALAEAAQARKLHFSAHDAARAQLSPALSELEAEAKSRTAHLLAKAKAQLEEQEDDIKKLNELALGAKCVAIRDTQVEEAKVKRAAEKMADLALDDMMERDRVAALAALAEREIARAKEVKKGASMIKQQIAERHEAALLEQERRDAETEQLLQSIAAQAEAEKIDREKKRRAQLDLMKIVTEANKASLASKQIAKVKATEEDKKLMEYLKEKNRQAEEKLKQAAAKSQEKEKEIARLRIAQAHMQGKHAQQDMLRVQRAAEETEREWRRKEKERAEKQAKLEAEVRVARAEQQRAREYAIMTAAYAAKQDFYDNLARQKAADDAYKKDQYARREKSKAHSKELKKQIDEKAEILRKERKEFLAQGHQANVDAIEQAKRLAAIKDKKISELRSIGVPQKYCNEVERQARAAAKPSFSKVK